VRLEDFDYELPPGLIAQRPAEPRDAARLFVHARASGRSEHVRVSDLPRFLGAGDLLVVNDTRVLPCRLFGRRASGGRVELLFVEPAGRPDRAWWALANPARRLKPGEVLGLEGGPLRARMLERPLREDGSPADEWLVALEDPDAPEDGVTELLERHGRVPLPPYIERAAEGAPPDESDRARYQTVYARVPGAVAAPTAGLHFTPELLDALAARGVARAAVTLHVGLGTFQPVKPEHLLEGRLHAERFVLPAATVAAVAATRRAERRIVAVGTTSARVLESAAHHRPLAPCAGTTDLFLKPGATFEVVDALLTNFHLPRSSLFMLVCAFLGTERARALYAEAIAERYRFYSYGDAMLLLP
jgi:S-adenosylmethionine:tRNA ribosyltransferase-isomerase